MDPLESQIAEWRIYVGRGRVVDDGDADELEVHLRDQIADLGAAGLSDDEAFLVAVKRLGDVDALSHEFARVHSERLWKQLVLGSPGRPEDHWPGWADAVVLALLAAAAIQIARLFAGWPDQEPSWFVRNAGLFVVPFLGAYFVRRRRLPARTATVTAALFAVAAIVVNVYPWSQDSSTELLVAAHLPVVLWFAVGFAYVGGEWRSSQRRMDFVRFSGEWFIYYVLIALGGGVFVGLTFLILEPVGRGVAEGVVEWVLPSGAAGAVIVAAWLVEAKQSVVENIAPVLAKVFTPLFAVSLAGSAVTYAVTGFGDGFDRELLAVFDAMLVVVFGLVLYGMSARDPSEPVGWMDRIQLVAIVAGLVLDLMVLWSMVARIGDVGSTPNRVAALGLNVVLLVNLAWAARLSAGFLSGEMGFRRPERWQTSYLPVFALWAAAVVVVLPPVFGFG